MPFSVTFVTQPIYRLKYENYSSLLNKDDLGEKGKQDKRFC